MRRTVRIDLYVVPPGTIWGMEVAGRVVAGGLASSIVYDPMNGSARKSRACPIAGSKLGVLVHRSECPLLGAKRTLDFRFLIPKRFCASECLL